MLRENFMSVGTTSACAENTVGASWRPRPSWNYLRVRGEYLRKIVNMHKQMELPPRARRIRISPPCPTPRRGTTSACAENTGTRHGKNNKTRNYLRVRGEYPHPLKAGGFIPELPPRARRILYEQDETGWHLGTTSACAENTALERVEYGLGRNYLRVRGEYGTIFFGGKNLVELPPRARRILTSTLPKAKKLGTTSACAENTHDGKTFLMIFWNYLRVRGEYRGFGQMQFTQLELPPRARRIRGAVAGANGYGGTTSACAENTLPTVRQCWLTCELPPRARRIHRHHPHSIRNHGTTSACAENTLLQSYWQARVRNYLRVRGEYFPYHCSDSFSTELPPRARRIPANPSG